MAPPGHSLKRSSGGYTRTAAPEEGVSRLGSRTRLKICDRPLDLCDDAHVCCPLKPFNQGVMDAAEDAGDPRPRAARRVEVLRPRGGAALRHPECPGRFDPRPRRRERRRQVDAGQDRRRRAPPRLGCLRARRRAGRLRLDRRVQGGGRRGDLPGAHPLPRPLGHREHLHGPADRRRRSPHRPCRDVRRGRGPLRTPRRRPGPPPSRPWPLHRRPADHRDRQGHLPRGAAAHHGRADRRPERGRGRPPLRRRPQPARRRPRAGLHLPPLRRGLRPVRHRQRDA